MPSTCSTEQFLSAPYTPFPVVVFLVGEWRLYLPSLCLDWSLDTDDFALHEVSRDLYNTSAWDWNEG